MVDLITWEQIININDNVFEISKKYSAINTLLDVKFIKLYDTVAIRTKMLKLFVNFRNAKYLNNFSLIDNIRITPIYEAKEVQITKSNVSQVEKTVEKFVDKELWVNDFYKSVLLLASKLTNEETVYFIDAFLLSMSENDIAEKLGICRITLQRYKQSCLVKMWIELKTYCEKDD